MSDFSFTEDMLDVRDLIERFEELEEGKQEFILNESETDDENPSWEEVADSNNKAEEKWLETEEGKELKQLTEILEELKGNGGDEQWNGDWYPITLINSDYFTDYTKELLDDCGYIPKEFPWWIDINWESTAENVKQDYASIDIGDETYYYR